MISATKRICLPPEFLWLPIGRHVADHATVDDGGQTVCPVVCDRETFDTVSADFDRLQQSGVTCFIDIGHRGFPIVATVTGFKWYRSEGIYVRVEWNEEYRETVASRDWRFSFSARYDRETERITRLEESGDCGGLVDESAMGDVAATIHAKTFGEALADVQRDLAAFGKSHGLEP